MLIVSMGWVFVVVLFAFAHATAPGGTILGAALTLVLGLAPLAVVLYIAQMAARRRRGRDAAASAADPDRGGHAPGDAVAPIREEP
jgi:hypothetical protein